MIPWLQTINDFPSTQLALEEPNGLLAAGGELTPSWLLRAYSLGIFPWYSEDDPILWWSPSPRCILTPSQAHISKSMRRLLKQNKYHCTADQAFNRVIDYCADTREEGTWILPEMKDAYKDLHQQGHAHSIEVWHQNTLIGGMYGIQIGSLFFGESMFSLMPNASKTAFIVLAKALDECSFQLLDCQVGSEHLYTLGAKDISRETFSQALSYGSVTPQGNPWQLINTNYEQAKLTDKGCV